MHSTPFLGQNKFVGVQETRAGKGFLDELWFPNKMS